MYIHNNYIIKEYRLIVRDLKKRKPKKKESTREDRLFRRDLSVVNHPLVAPEKRVPRHIQVARGLNLRTRGHPDNYQYMGNLIRKNDEKIIRLYGRQTYPSSSQYEYYGIVSDGGMATKITISNTKEIYNGDKVSLPLIGTSKGDFIAQIHKNEAPRYIPYL